MGKTLVLQATGMLLSKSVKKHICVQENMVPFFTDKANVCFTDNYPVTRIGQRIRGLGFTYSHKYIPKPFIWKWASCPSNLSPHPSIRPYVEVASSPRPPHTHRVETTKQN